MRSHWTNPTIIRRPTIAVLSAAALLVACDQPTDPASRPGGRILADATGRTVSAHGSGTVPGRSCWGLAVCNAGGLKFSFDFSGTNTTGTDATQVFGKWSASDPVTNVQLEFTGGTATVIQSSRVLTVAPATCTITTADGKTEEGGCFLQAFDNASNGAVDTICFQGNTFNGFIVTMFVVGSCPQLASGNMNID